MVDSLLHLAILLSSSGACVALAEFIAGSEPAFVSLMNETASAMGMFSEFTNSHGTLPHYTNAYSIGILVRTFIERHPDILRITSATSVDFQGTRLDNTNNLLSYYSYHYSGADGFIPGATTAIRDGRRIIAVVMDAPDSTKQYSDSIALLDFGFTEVAIREATVAGVSRGETLRWEMAWAEARDDIHIVMDGTFLPLEVQPRFINYQVMVPARPIFEMLGARVEADGTSMTVFTSNGNMTITPFSNWVMVNDTAYWVNTAPQRVNGHVFVALKLIADSTGKTVFWYEETNTAVFASP
jgi:hypothetical protein